MNHALDSCSLLLAKQVSRVTDLMPNPILQHNTRFHPCVLETTCGSERSQRGKLVIRLISSLISRHFMDINQQLLISYSWHCGNFKEILYMLPPSKQ
jgi:hypothetical protein